MFSSTPRLFGIALVICLGALGVALATQHLLDMQPCPWCVLQRIIMVGIAAFAALGLLWRSRAGTWVAATLMGVLAACGASAALWQHFVANKSLSCKLTLADRIVSGSGLDALAPDIFAARASCADAITALAGVPYEFWSLASFVVLGALAAAALRTLFRRHA